MEWMAMLVFYTLTENYKTCYKMLNSKFVMFVMENFLRSALLVCLVS